jgi:hypothetical protein
MGVVLLAMLGPTVVFGLFALVAVRFGAESRPYFDERPVLDDRPNWFPIAGAGSGSRADDEDDVADPRDGEPVPAAVEPAARPALARRQPVTAAVASASSAATNPSGV